MLPVAEHDLTGAREPDYPVTVELRECARDRFQRESEIIANVSAAHRQCHHAGSGETAVHLEQEARHPLHRVLATEQQHVIFGVPEFAGGHSPEAAGHLNRDAGRLFKIAAFHQAHGRIGDGFRGQAMGQSGLKSKDVAGQVERTNLSAAIGEQLVAPDRAANDLIDVFSGLVFSIDFLVLLVGEFRGDQAGVTGNGVERGP
jgi:hypothetical protein